jgi:outer membrane receptor for ferrienterochelin and colicins
MRGSWADGMGRPLTAVGTLAVLLHAVALGATASALSAQEPVPAVAPAADGRLSGRVTDAAMGRGMADAEVFVSGPDSAWMRTDAGGGWSTVALRAGHYRVRARRLGYVAATVTIELRAGAHERVALTLTAAPLALDQVVVTAARRAQRLADAVATTEVVSRADIERTGASDLASVLTEQTGIQLQGGIPAGAGVMLQGLGSERVLVLLDGQPIAGRIGGVFDISRIPTAVVERIEVVKGPQSTLYGTDAMGGVINIITRTPARDALGATLAATGGTQTRRDGVASFAFGRGALTSQWDLARRSTEMTPGRADGTGALATRTDAAAKVRWSPDSARFVEASMLALDERQRWRTSAFYNFGDNRQWSGRLTGAWQGGRHRIAPTVYASVYDHVSRASTEPKPIAGDTGQRQRQRVYQAEVLYTGRFGAHAIDLGTQVRRDETETERVTGGFRSIVLVEPFVQADIAVTSRFSVVPGVRVSRSAQWETHVTPRLASRWRPAFGGDRLALRASVGEGFRAPDFKELFMFFQNTSAGYAVIGNPALRPESSRNVTGGAEWTAERGFVRGQLFWNRFRDFIETRAITRPDEPPVYQYRNVDDGVTRGLELETGLAAAGWRLEGGYSGLATRDDATGRPLLGRPTHSARLLLGRTLPLALRTSVSAVATGSTPMERDDATGAITSWRDAFARVDARVSRTLSGGMELVLGADNLFDQQPGQWAGFTGRHLYTSLSWTINRTSTP